MAYAGGPGLGGVAVLAQLRHMARDQTEALCLCVCLCASVKERERERESSDDSETTRQRERERERDGGHHVSVCVSVAACRSFCPMTTLCSGGDRSSYSCSSVSVNFRGWSHPAQCSTGTDTYVSCLPSLAFTVCMCVNISLPTCQLFHSVSDRGPPRRRLPGSRPRRDVEVVQHSVLFVVFGWYS